MLNLNRLQVSIFGESHGEAIGVVLEGLPAGETIDHAVLQQFLRRRQPGLTPWSTARKETDEPVFLSGMTGGMTNGFPIAATIQNQNKRSGDYTEILYTPRPGHADYSAYRKYNGQADMRGGGHFSGRLTAPLCIAGGLAKQILERKGIFVGACIERIGAEADSMLFEADMTEKILRDIAEKPFPVLDDAAAQRMQDAIAAAKAQLDSVGGKIRCTALGVPPGLGDPMFGSMEGRIAQAVFGIPAITAIAFGQTFCTGAENNDRFCCTDGKVQTETNHHGGILGGITTGMPVWFTVTVKPTPSIAQQQQTVNLQTGENVTMQIKGRHDPCIVPRAVPCIEAAAALVLLDALLSA